MHRHLPPCLNLQTLVTFTFKSQDVYLSPHPAIHMPTCTHTHTHTPTHTCMDALVYAKLWELIKAPNISAETMSIISLITFILLSMLRSRDWRKVKKDMKGNSLCSADILRILYFLCRTMFAPGNKKNEPKIHVLMGQQWRLGGSQENGQWWLSVRWTSPGINVVACKGWKRDTGTCKKPVSQISRSPV